MRVSTQEQFTKGYGLESQEKQLREHLEREGLFHHPVELYSDVQTGRESDRPGLQQLQKDIRQGKVKMLLVWKLDRLSRKNRDLLALHEFIIKHDVRLVSLQERMDFEGISGKMLFGIQSTFAEYESNTIRSRTYTGKIASAKSGNFVGKCAPYGFRKVKNACGKGSHLEVVPERWV